MGMIVVDAIRGMLDGHVKVFMALGGNFSIATPDTDQTWKGLRQCELTVNITTKLNRSHLVHGKHALILPCLGRTEVGSTSQRRTRHYGRRFHEHGARFIWYEQASLAKSTL